MGDYTIIQITAGYNLVADVSRSTMPTTHMCVCVRAYMLKEFQRCRARKEQRIKQKTKQQDFGSGRAIFFESMCEN